MTKLTDYAGHTLTGQAFPINGNQHPSRAIVATVTGVTDDGTGLVIAIADDDLETNAIVHPIFDDEIGFGETPFNGTGDAIGGEWEFDLDFWK